MFVGRKNCGAVWLMAALGCLVGLGAGAVTLAQVDDADVQAMSDTTLEWPAPQVESFVPFMPSFSEEGTPAVGEPGFAPGADLIYGEMEGPNSEACFDLNNNLPILDAPNIGDPDRSVALIVNQPTSASSLAVAVAVGQAIDVRVDIRELVGNVRQAAILGTGTASFNPGGMQFITVPINFTFLPGHRYDVSFTATPGWGFNIHTMRFLNFNNSNHDPNLGFDAGPFRVLDGGAGGNYSNTVMPLVRYCDAACVNPVDLRNLPGNFDQSSFGRANTQLYAQSIQACNRYLSEVRVAGTHTSGNDVLFNIRITGARLDTGNSSGMGAKPNFSDIRWTSFTQRFPAGGGLTEVTVNPNIGVNIGQTYFIVLDAFSQPNSGLGTVRATQFNGPNDPYAGGEFVFINASGENNLQDFDARDWSHRKAANEDLAVRAVFTAGEAPRAGVIDFQALETHNANVNLHGASYDEEGYRIEHVGGANLSFFGTQERRYPQSTALFNNTVNGVSRLSRINGGLFDLIELKLAELNGPNGAPVNFTGFKQGGGQVQHNVNTDGIGPQNGLQRFVFPNTFTGLERVEWAQVSPFHQYDDIVVRDAVSGTCKYKIKKSKSQGGCPSCPAKNSIIGTNDPCNIVTDCRKKLKTVINCPAGPGSCSIKAKRSACS